MQMGIEMNRKELINCCQEVFDNIGSGIKRDKIGVISQNIRSAFSKMMGRSKKTEKPIDPFPQLITYLLLKGVETKQKEMIWFAVQNGIKEGLFYKPNEIKKMLEATVVSKEPLSKRIAAKLSCRQLIDELSNLSPPLPTFNKELGQIELDISSSQGPFPLRCLSAWVPLTITPKNEVSEKDYIDFIEKLTSSQIHINVNKWDPDSDLYS